MSVNANALNQRMITGGAGAAVGSIGGGLGVWTAAARPGNPNYEIIVVQYPVLNRGESLTYTIPNQAYSGQDSAAIMAQSNNVELAARFLDFGYTAQGHRLYNFGIEGVSYTLVNGEPRFTDFVMTGSGRDWPLAQSLSAHMRSPMAGPFIQDVGYIRQYYDLPEQYQGLLNLIVPGALALLRPAMTPTPDESREIASIMQGINTYIEERTARWILGTETLTDANWNDYLSTINRMGIDRALALEEQALQRFRNR